MAGETSTQRDKHQRSSPRRTLASLGMVFMFPTDFGELRKHEGSGLKRVA